MYVRSSGFYPDTFVKCAIRQGLAPLFFFVH